MIGYELDELISKWRGLDRGERVKLVWQTANSIGALILPFLLIFAFLFSLPSYPSSSVLLVLIGMGIVWVFSVTLSGIVTEYYEI